MTAPILQRLLGKTALVTGAAQGLGEALAWRLAREGADVVIADIADDAAQQVATAIAAETGRRTLWAHGDVTDAAQIEALCQRALTEIEPARWEKVIQVNLVGYFNVARAAAKVMIPQRSGVIIQINSKSGKKGSSKNSAYAASKFGGIGLTQSLGLELAEHNVRCNAICPGNLLDSPLWVNSLYSQYAKRWGISEAEVRQRYVDQVPMKRGCTYEDVANVLVFLASDESAYMTGQAINVTGGQEMN